MNKYIDADLLIRKIKNQIRLENLNFAALGGGEQSLCIKILTWVLKQIDSLQQEQPEVELEKELDKFYDSPLWERENVSWMTYTRIALHFYELGLKARKEE